MEIIPSILVESHQEFERRLRLVEGGCETVHVDILDGSLFPETNWFDAKAVGALRTNVKYEIHLMVENPLPIITEWQRHVSGLVRAIVHAEMHRPIGAVVSQIRDLMKLEAGIAVNPETPLLAIHEMLHIIDQLTVMGVHPGSSGQTFLGEEILETIREARAHRADLPIELDGGAREDLFPALKEAGVTHVCAASAIFGAKDPKAALAHLRQA